MSQGKIQYRFLEQCDPKSLVAAARGLAPGTGEALGVFVAEGGEPDLAGIQGALRQAGIPSFGGLFPGVIWDARQRERGVILARLPLHQPPALITGLGQGGYEERLRALADQLGDDPATALILVDGLSPRLGALMHALYAAFGEGVTYLGGGAGSLSLQPTPCVFTGEGLAGDAMVLALLDLPARLGVRHGWIPVGQPLLSTQTQGNRIRELNWQPAYELYRDAVQRDGGAAPNRDAFFDVAKGYPFGIYREGAEPVVRDPIAVEGSDILCVGEVPENALLQVLHGEPDRLIAAARRAAQDSAIQGGENAFVVDCISRVIFLEDRFREELEAVRDGMALPADRTLPGILSLGEIASNGDQYLELFNKTIVVGQLGG